MNKKQLALLQAARISVSTWEKAGKEDVSDDDFKADIDDYTETQLQYWKDKHPDYTPDKLKEQEKKFRDEGEARAIRKMLKDFNLTEAEVKGKTPEEVAALALSKVKPVDDSEARKTAEEYKTKALTLEEQIRKINEEVIPGIHNEYKTKESEGKRMEELLKPFSKLPVVDELKRHYNRAVLDAVEEVGIITKLNDKGQLEYFDKDGTKAKNKAGKDLTTEDFVELVKPNLKGYIKESNGGEQGKKEAEPAGKQSNKVSDARQKKIEENKRNREATLAGAK